MINASVAMLRKLHEFIEQEFGLGSWESVTVDHTGQGENDEYEFVRINFCRDGRAYIIEVTPPNDELVLGRVDLIETKGPAGSGPLSAETFKCIGRHIKAADRQTGALHV